MAALDIMRINFKQYIDISTAVIQYIGAILDPLYLKLN